VRKTLVNIAAKFTLWSFVLPTVLVIVFFTAGFYVYKNSFGATSFFMAVDGFFSFIFIAFISWEELNDGLNKRMDYVNANFFKPLYQKFHQGYQDIFNKQDDTAKIIEKMRKYCKFITISLFPRDLLDKIGKFLSLQQEFYQRWERIDETAKTAISPSGFTTFDLAQFIGFNINFRSGLSDNWVKSLEKQRDAVLRAYPKLINETIELFEETRKVQEEVLTELTEFLVSNSLEFQPQSEAQKDD